MYLVTTSAGTLYQLLGADVAKASLLFSMEQAVVQGWVGLDPVEEACNALRNKQPQQVTKDVEIVSLAATITVVRLLKS